MKEIFIHVNIMEFLSILFGANLSQPTAVMNLGLSTISSLLKYLKNYIVASVPLLPIQ